MESNGGGAANKRQRLPFSPAELAAMEVRAMECIRQLLLRSGEALFLLQLISPHHVTRLIQGFDANLQQVLVQLTFHQLVCSDEGDCLATRLISALMETCVSQRQKTNQPMVWAIALHGGAGVPYSLPPELRQPREEALHHCLQIGIKALNSKMTPLDVVELVVRELENIPHFNAGRGSVLTNKGTVEMEASIMDGKTMKCGAVSGLTTVVNAISLARLVMEKTPHIYLAFDGAEDFAREQGVETVDSSYFITPENIERLNQAKDANRVQIDYTQPIQNDTKNETETPFANGDSQTGTVGCVAVDSNGNLASATSTGGLVNKMVGRIGDTSVIGAGTYANELCAVSATGVGEAIIRGTVARDVAALMEFKGLSLKEAANVVVQERTPKGTVGLVAVSSAGEIAMPYNTPGMFRACATEDGYSEVSIWSNTKIEKSLDLSDFQT